MSDPFRVLGLAADCSQDHVLKAWRRLAREHHSDKTGAGDDSVMKTLNAAKEQCLKSIIERDYNVSEQEFVWHICRVLERKLAEDLDLHIDLGQGRLIEPKLRQFFFIRAADAMQWILVCVVGDIEFNQDIEDEIPILCRFYNDYIREDEWSDNDHTMMMVLNKYDKIKAGGYGNFARFLE
jgi:hypothetical protein